MHSRLYKRVLNKYDWVHNCTAFSSLYNDTGLVGIFMSAESQRANEALDIITTELQVSC
jgi:processing peptidase subunit alpha